MELESMTALELAAKIRHREVSAGWCEGSL